MARNQTVIPISVFGAGLSAGLTAAGVGITGVSGSAGLSRSAVSSAISQAFRHLEADLTANALTAENAVTNSLREFRDKMFDVVKNEDRYFVRDHTPAELEALGHPYALRRPAYAGLHDVDEAIHRQSERLYDSMVPYDDPAIPLFGVKIGGDSLQYWRFLKFGTSKMVPRDLGARIVSDFLPEFKKTVIQSLRNQNLARSEG